MAVSEGYPAIKGRLDQGPQSFEVPAVYLGGEPIRACFCKRYNNSFIDHGVISAVEQSGVTVKIARTDPTVIHGPGIDKQSDQIVLVYIPTSTGYYTTSMYIIFDTGLAGPVIGNNFISGYEVQLSSTKEELIIIPTSQPTPTNNNNPLIHKQTHIHSTHTSL